LKSDIICFAIEDQPIIGSERREEAVTLDRVRRNVGFIERCQRCQFYVSEPNPLDWVEKQPSIAQISETESWPHPSHRTW
jgi:hypothetical protein